MQTESEETRTQDACWWLPYFERAGRPVVRTLTILGDDIDYKWLFDNYIYPSEDERVFHFARLVIDDEENLAPPAIKHMITKFFSGAPWWTTYLKMASPEKNLLYRTRKCSFDCLDYRWLREQLPSEDGAKTPIEKFATYVFGDPYNLAPSNIRHLL